MSFDLAQVSDLLVCPACHAPLVMADERLISVSPAHRRAYPILDGIPRLLVVESEELSVDDWGDIMERNGRDRVTGEPTGTTTATEE